VATARLDANHLGEFTSHHRLASPVAPWERLKIGCGTPPVLTRHGWLVMYHGVSEVEPAAPDAKPNLRYSAGLLMLSEGYPRFIKHRSLEPVLVPVLRKSGAASSRTWCSDGDRPPQ